MHSIKDIRKNINHFKSKLKDRSSNINFDNLLMLDEKNRNLIQKKEKLENEKKRISKSNDKSLFKRSKEISKELDNISFDGNNEIFFPNRSTKEIHFAILITSWSSKDSALLIETEASDHAWAIFETKIDGSKFTWR